MASDIVIVLICSAPLFFGAYLALMGKLGKETVRVVPITFTVRKSGEDNEPRERHGTAKELP